MLPTVAVHVTPPKPSRPPHGPLVLEREPAVIVTWALCGAEPAAVAGPLSVAKIPPPGPNIVTGPCELVIVTPALAPLPPPPPVAVIVLLMLTPSRPVSVTVAGATLPVLVAAIEPVLARLSVP